jgi:hypothetical protein
MKIRHEIFTREYTDEELYDLERDVSEALQEDYNPIVASIPKDKHGFRTGTFVVSIEWIND